VANTSDLLIEESVERAEFDVPADAERAAFDAGNIGICGRKYVEEADGGWDFGESESTPGAALGVEDAGAGEHAEDFL